MAGAIDLSGYVEVSERVRAFYARHPGGAIRTELVHLTDGLVVFRAEVYRDPADPHPTTGWAYEREGSTPVNRTRFVENCETSAVGRALANLGFAGGRRPSREEMEKVERMRGGEAGGGSRRGAGKHSGRRDTGAPEGGRENGAAAGAGEHAGAAAGAGEGEGAAGGDASPERIRSLLERLSLSAPKRRRIEEKLAAGLTAQEAHDLEAYLLALSPGRP